MVLHLAAAAQPGRVETLYSRGLFPPIARTLSAVSSRVPFPVAEPLLVLALAAAATLAIRRLWRLRSRRFWPALLEVLARTAFLAGVVDIAFLALWGLNYHRETLARSAALEIRTSSPAELEALAHDLVEEANALRVGLAEDSGGVFQLPAGPREAFARAAAGFEAARERLPFLQAPPARPKAALLSALLSGLAISGIYSPFTAEPLVNGEVPDPDLPFCAAHEAAHAAGFAREDEANYLASLTCRLHPDADFRYSGTMAASAYAMGALASVDRPSAKRLHGTRSAAVVRDLDALAAWSARHEGRVAEASRRVNDAYLKAQGTPDGVRSYGRFVDLLLAERRAAGRPVSRAE